RRFVARGDRGGDGPLAGHGEAGAAFGPRLAAGRAHRRAAPPMIDLDATRWQEIRQHFEALLRLRSRDQSAALARIGATDPEMGSALAALLAADEESSGLLRISSGGSGGRAASQGADLLGHAGRTISHFRVLRP